jgi:putative DNA primase/helicase
MMTPIDRILSLLPSAKKTASGWQARCPAHDDKNPSLSITEKNGTALLFCHAGCPVEKILQSLGLQTRDLFSEDTKKPKVEKAVWDSPETFGAWYARKTGTQQAGLWRYQQADGNDCLTILRFDKANGEGELTKEYRPLHKSGSGWFIGDPPGQLPLYNLPAIFSAPASEPVFVCEGEKCADAGKSIGLLCTTSSHGAESPKRTDWLPLKGRNVVILPDNDKPGRTYAQAVASLLNNIAMSIKIVPLPGLLEKGNLYDYVEALDGKESAEIREGIEQLCIETPLWMPPQLETSEMKSVKMETASQQIEENFECTDLGNSRRFVHKFREDFLFCEEMGGWLVWNGKKWQQDKILQVLERAKTIPQIIFKESQHCTDPGRQKFLAKWAASSQLRARIEAFVSLARSEVAVESEIFDTDPWLLNLLNGTFDLHSSEFRPAQCEDFITKIAPVKYDPLAYCLVWLKYLDRIMAGNQEKIDFLQRLIGLCLTGDISEQKFFLFWGEGANGKSVFVETILALLGDYATPAAPDLLIQARQPRHPTEIADLRGRRLVIASESGAGRRLNESFIKNATGDTEQKARFCGQDFFTFRRTYKTILVTNNKPRIREDTLAIWRRICLVPFTITIPPEEQDLKLSQKLKIEYPGILNWALAGCRSWQQNGLQIPTEVTVATQQYQMEQDLLAEFLSDCCVFYENASVPRQELFTAYCAWAEREKELFPLQRRDFYEHIRQKKLEESRKNIGGVTCRLFRGIGLRKNDCVSGDVTAGH